jgi:hypothetical protein
MATTTTKQAVQELKSERVQEEIALVVGDEPFRISLKSERVQQPGALAAGPDAQSTSSFEMNLALSPKQTVRIDLSAFGASITI